MQEKMMQVVRQKHKLLSVLLVILFVCYFLLPLSLAFFPDIMLQKTMIGNLSVIWIYTFLQIPLTWFLGLIYFGYSKKIDEQIIELQKQRDIV